MSWVVKIEDQLVITTGDGAVYKPLWKNPTRSLEWNVAEFDFPELDGTLVKKGNLLGRKFPLEFYFQGNDHLEQTLAFEKSANDKRPWTIEHPFYGTLIVQVPALEIDNTGLNTSKITGLAIETIVDDNPKTSIDPVDAISIGKTNLDTVIENALTETPDSTDINTMSANVSNNKKLGIKIITIPEEAENYLNLFSTANTYINTATASPLLAMRAVVAFMTAPAKFTASVKDRMDLLANQFTLMRASLSLFTTVSSKQIYQNQATAIVSAMTLAASTPLSGNYTNSNSALQIITQLITNYNSLIADLDELQTANGGSPESFIPDPFAIGGLNVLMSLTVSNLYSIALNSKKERSIIAEHDTNIILLTHRFYGLDPSDANIDEFMDNNNIGLNQIFQIKKGTKIVYYI